MDDTTVSYSSQQKELAFTEAHNYKTLQEYLKDYRLVLCKAEKELELLLGSTDEFHSATNKWRIGATTTGAISTILSLIGIGLIPVTFGASLGLTSAGLALGVGAAGVSIRNGYKDYKTTKKMNNEMKDIFDSLQAKEQVVRNFMFEMKQQMEDLLDSGLDFEQAVAITAFGHMRGVLECGRIVKNAGSIALPIISSVSDEIPKVVANYGQISGTIAKSFSSSAVNMSKVILPFGVGLGVLLTGLDIALLIRTLNTDHPVASSLKTAIAMIRERRLKCDNIILNLENFMLRNCLGYNVGLLHKREAQLKVKYGNKEKELERKYECKLDVIKDQYDKNMKKTEESYQDKIKGLEDKMKDIEEKSEHDKRAQEERILKLEAIIQKLVMDKSVN